MNGRALKPRRLILIISLKLPKVQHSYGEDFKHHEEFVRVAKSVHNILKLFPMRDHGLTPSMKEIVERVIFSDPIYNPQGMEEAHYFFSKAIPLIEAWLLRNEIEVEGTRDSCEEDDELLDSDYSNGWNEFDDELSTPTEALSALATEG
jgi:hypothetical protein